VDSVIDSGVVVRGLRSESGGGIEVSELSAMSVNTLVERFERAQAHIEALQEQLAARDAELARVRSNNEWNNSQRIDHIKTIVRLYRELQDAPQQPAPVAWQFYEDKRWWNGDERIPNHRANTEAAGIPVRNLYTASTAMQQEIERLREALEELLYARTDKAEAMAKAALKALAPVEQQEVEK
jgi:chromosome segregation ATPase